MHRTARNAFIPCLRTDICARAHEVGGSVVMKRTLIAGMCVSFRARESQERRSMVPRAACPVSAESITA